MANLVYNPKDISQKKFKTKMMDGCDPIEVDELLGDVIKDYEAYNKELLSLQGENSHLMAKLDQLSRAQPTPHATQRVPESATTTSFNVLKRLSNLEREVFGRELDETPSAPVTPSAPSMTAEPANHDVDNTQTRQF